MKSKEIVKRAIEFRQPTRVPYNFDSNRTPVIDTKYGDDFEWVFAGVDPNFVPSINTETEYENEWGIIFERIGKTSGEAKVYPLDDRKKIKEYKVPDLSNPARYKGLEEQIRKNKDKYILGMFPHFLFLHMLDMFGFENLMVELMLNREGVEHIADLLTESCINVVNCMADRGVDGMIAIEDLGVQDRLIISPTLWREVFKPRYKRIIEALHKRNMHFIIHSCGHIFELIEDLIEIKTDVLQIDQQDNMGIDKLADSYAGRICFFCPVDIQSTLPVASHDEIEASAKKLIDSFGTKDGGFMAKTYPQPEAIDIPEVNTAYMCEIFKKHGQYYL